MNIVFAHDHKFREIYGKYYSTGGLSNEVITRYTDIFENVNIIARIIQENNDGNKLSEITNSKVKIINVPFKRKAKEIIEEYVNQSDGVIARLPSLIGNIAVDVATKYNKPYMIEMVGCPWDAFWNHSLKGKIVAPYMYYATKKRVKNANYVIYVTNEFLQGRYPTNGDYTNCSNVALTEFADKILEKRLKKIESMLSNNKIVIGTTAAIDVRYKGQQYVIKALSKLKKQGILNFEYQLVGGGNQTYLKSIAKKNNVTEQIKFLGTMPHNKVFEWLDTIDIYVQPSRQEGLPRALIEAMSRGVPAFGARTAGIPELLEDKYIFSNTRRNIDEICEILISFDKKTMLKQAKRNFEEAKKYDKNIIEERRRKFFENFKNEIIIIDHMVK